MAKAQGATTRSGREARKRGVKGGVENEGRTQGVELGNENGWAKTRRGIQEVGSAHRRKC